MVNVGKDMVGEEDEAMKEEVDTKVVRWMKTAYKNKNLDMQVKSTKKDIICVLLDIILY